MPHECLVPRGQEKALAPFELELQIALDHLVGAGKWICLGPLQKYQVLLTTQLPLQLHLCIFKKRFTWS